MAIKKLQINYTTPEQSKRLLELGVPADSADCFYSESAYIKYGEVYFEYNTEPEILPKSAITGETILFSEYKNKYTGGYVLPCWSVGRLIEIHETCTSCLFERRFPQLSVLEDVLAQIAEDTIATDECFDFSKLEY